MKQPKSIAQRRAECDEIGTVIDLVRQNLRLLTELVQRYEVGHQETMTDGRTMRKPADVVGFLGQR